MTLTGQLGRLNGAQLHGWGTGQRRTQDFSAMALKNDLIYERQFVREGLKKLAKI